METEFEGSVVVIGLGRDREGLCKGSIFQLKSIGSSTGSTTGLVL